MAADDDRPVEPRELDARACPTCRRSLPPWRDDCPVCREPATLWFSLPGSALPAVPGHLREADDDPAAGAELGARKEEIEPFGAEAPGLPAMAAEAWWLSGGGAGGGGGGAGGCGGGGGDC